LIQVEICACADETLNNSGLAAATAAISADCLLPTFIALLQTGVSDVACVSINGVDGRTSAGLPRTNAYMPSPDE
jgi:hypothetical protein